MKVFNFAKTLSRKLFSNRNETPAQNRKQKKTLAQLQKESHPALTKEEQIEADMASKAERKRKHSGRRGHTTLTNNRKHTKGRRLQVINLKNGSTKVINHGGR